MGIIIANAAPADDSCQIIARSQWQHSNLALLLHKPIKYRKSMLLVCPVITLCNQTRDERERSTHIHMELVDFGKDPTDRSVAAANQDPEWIKVPE
jgi:hypothetical protein